MSSMNEELNPSILQETDDDIDIDIDMAVPSEPSAQQLEPKKVSLDDYKRYQELFVPKLLSEDDMRKAKQQVQNALHADDQDDVMDEEHTIEGTLQLLKTNLEVARAGVEKLLHEGAKLTAQQLRLRQNPVPKKEAERAISSLIDDNTLRLSEAEKVVTDTTARIKTLESVRKAALSPVLHDTAVDESNSTHVAIKRIFKYHLIPVLADGASIDWDRVRHDSHVGGPTLNLTSALSKATTKESMALPAAQAVSAFLESFRTFYKGKLVELFEFLAWRYMESALKPSGLDEEYKVLIEMLPVGDRSWNMVTEYVIKLTNLDSYRHLVKSHLFTLKLEPGEPACNRHRGECKGETGRGDRDKDQGQGQGKR